MNRFLIFIFLIAILTGCGQAGKLTLPNQTKAPMNGETP